MAFVIGPQCIDVKDGACVKCCPVDCIYEGNRMFYIHPDECISCGICVSVCPVEAITDELDLPSGPGTFTAINREFFGPDVSGAGAPGGAEGRGKIEFDHPLVAARPHATK